MLHQQQGAINMTRLTKAQRELKAKKEYAIKKCVSVLTCNKPINIFNLATLEDKLEAMDLGDLAMIIASEYSPEGAMHWKDLFDDQAA